MRLAVIKVFVDPIKNNKITLYVQKLSVKEVPCSFLNLTLASLVQDVSQRKHECEVMSEVLKSGLSLLWEEPCARELVGGSPAGRSNPTSRAFREYIRVKIDSKIWIF